MFIDKCFQTDYKIIFLVIVWESFKWIMTSAQMAPPISRIPSINDCVQYILYFSTCRYFFSKLYILCFPFLFYSLCVFCLPFVYLCLHWSIPSHIFFWSARHPHKTEEINMYWKYIKDKMCSLGSGGMSQWDPLLLFCCTRIHFPEPT